MEQNNPLPPFNFEAATLKVQFTENAWNFQYSEKVLMAYNLDTEYRKIGLYQPINSKWSK